MRRSDGSLKGFRDLFDYLLVRAVFGLSGRMAPGTGDRLGAALGRLAYRLGWRRRVVETQLARAFPDRDEDWVRRTARETFEHVGREAVALARIARLGVEEVRRCVPTFEGREALQAAFEKGRGVVMVSGHFGNWEIAGSALPAYGFPVDAVIQGMRNPRLNRYVQRVRRRLGMRLIDRAGAWDRLLAGLKAGRVVAFVADQDARERGVFVPFFGRPASTHRAPALLALRAGAPFFVGGAHRVGPDRYHAWTVKLEPPDGVGVGDKVLELTNQWASELERRARLSPEQYFWHHKRWKTRPPGTAPAEAGTSLQGTCE